MGASQSIGRAMVGCLTPPERTAQMFALWSVAVRLAAILGPLLYGVVTWVSAGQQRWAIGVTSLLFIVGLWVLAHIEWNQETLQALAKHRESE